MPRIFITGSTVGLGRAAAETLLAQGCEVVLHARSAERASAIADLAGRASGVCSAISPAPPTPAASPRR